MQTNRSGGWFPPLWIVLVILGIAFVVMRESRKEAAIREQLTDLQESLPVPPVRRETPPLSAVSAAATPSTTPTTSDLPPAVGSAADSGSLSHLSRGGTVSGAAPLEDRAQDLLSARRAFRTLAETVFQKLPTMKSLQGLTSAEAHQAPKAVREAGEDLGKIAERLSDDPRLAQDGVSFYEQCYKRSDLITQVRALCLADFRHWRKLSAATPGGVRGREDLINIPHEVVELAAQIPDSN